MFRKLNTRDALTLFPLLSDPSIFPYVRHKADSMDAYSFVLKGLLHLEEKGLAIPRIILDERGNPIGMILLYDIIDGVGYLSTWIGKDYFGQGYNAAAKEAFFQELFLEQDIHTILVKINKQNVRSRQASLKLPYIQLIDEHFKQDGRTYDLFTISKHRYLGIPSHMDDVYVVENEA
ncbi:GNAT family N-acetyltransferase [Bacillaceae bacterium SIJ1]|nr:GNAT family N-acetyltransferase [Litoribacterium kuwaitense]